MFAPLVGNARFLLLSLVVSWTLAAFGEELVYRGYLMNRAAELAGKGRLAWGTCLVLTSILSLPPGVNDTVGFALLYFGEYPGL
jgi:membrane protease YdiL (CAAX protease family)